MHSKLKFDVGPSNEPLITFDIKHTDDLRDKIANQCIEALGHTSSWFRVEFYPAEGGRVGALIPVRPEEMEREVKLMMERRVEANFIPSE